MSIILEPCRWSYLGGKLLPSERAMMPVDSHPLHYGSAAFESIRLYATPLGARIVALDMHLERLASTIDDLHLATLQLDEARDAIMGTIKANALENGYLRLLA